MKKTIVLKSAIQTQEAIAAIRRCPVDGSWAITLKETSKRNLEQNARMWCMLKNFSDQLIWQGFKLSPEEYKDFFTAGLKKFKIVPDMHMSGYVSVGGHTSTMTVKEMAELIELMVVFGAEHSVRFTAPKSQKEE